MASVAKTITPSLATKLPCGAHRSHNLFAGEAISAGDPCYIKNDGLAWRSTGAAVAAAAKVDGWATIDSAAGMPVTLYHGVQLAWGPATLTPGTRLFLDVTAGSLSTTATTGGTGAVAIVDYIAGDESTPHAVIHAMKSTY